ncbi:MAG: hypothetical protein H6741_19085 [Alphaproteobacteria bacterium]|nr:hypothetical protein [Alphaproteobacteria bacterium]MCB9794816.1 hypothetical protein [Alphaproteobacteria bacterium]
MANHDAEALRRVHGSLGYLPQPWVVRSSAQWEDTRATTAAGIFTSVLGVENTGLEDAVGHVVDSAWSETATAYQAKMKIWRSPSMSVLVQRQVPALKSGVLFTRDPNSARARMTIEAIGGHPDSLVSGRTTPGGLHVYPDGTRTAYPGQASESDVEEVLSPEELAALLDLAKECMGHMGESLDIEWAWAEGGLWLLQCRPLP